MLDSVGIDEEDWLEGTSTSTTSLSTTDDSLEPDVEDYVGAEEVTSAFTGLASDERTGHAFVQVSSDSDKHHAHKATVLRLLSSNSSEALSTDRLRRVRGFTKYTPRHFENFDSDPETGPAVLFLQDPAITLVACDEKIFLAVVQLVEIKVDGSCVQSVPESVLSEPNTQVSFQIMQLEGITPTEQSPSLDWEWAKKYEPLPGSSPRVTVPGRFIEPINPCLIRSSTSDSPTWSFDTKELCAFARSTFERLRSGANLLPVVPRSATFPYRTGEGKH